jgi:hypothetical protein
VKTEIVLKAFTGYCYMCKEEGHRATHCPSKEEKKSEAGGIGRHFNGNCNQSERQGQKKSECWEMPENEDKRPAGYKPKAEYGHAAISSGLGIEFVLCALGGEQFGGKAEAPECPEKQYKDEEQAGEDLVDYLGCLDHVEDLIVTEPIEVVEETVTKVEKENVDWYLNIKEVDEEGKCVLVAKQSGRESKAVMKKGAKKQKKDKNVGCVRVQSHNGRVSEVSCENCTQAAVAAKKKKLTNGCG